MFPFHPKSAVSERMLQAEVFSKLKLVLPPPYTPYIDYSPPNSDGKYLNGEIFDIVIHDGVNVHIIIEVKNNTWEGYEAQWRQNEQCQRYMTYGADIFFISHVTWRPTNQDKILKEIVERLPLSRIISISALPWEERQAGVKRRILWEDPATQRRTIMFRIEPSAQFSCHRHIGDELIFVIEGAISDEFGTVTAGNMGYRPNGCVHALSTKNGATLLAILTGSTEPATERGNAPPTEIFALHDLPWVETGPGVRQKQIWEDKAGERRAILACFEPGATLPPHRHVGDELIFLIEGANADESGVVATGNMNYRPNGCVHSVTTQHGATVLAVVWGRTEPV